MTVKEQVTKKISRSLDGSLFFNNSFPNYDDVYVRNYDHTPFRIKALQILYNNLLERRKTGNLRP